MLPPEGIAFDGEGMLGQAWMDTPMGVFDDTSRQSRHWSLILDTKNFKGPVAYYMPEFWSVTGKWTNYDGKKYPTEDFSKTGMSSSSYAFEIHSPPAFREQTADGEVFLKIPKMQMGRNMGDKTVLMAGFKSWHDKKDLYTIVDNLMSGTSSPRPKEFDDSQVLKTSEGLYQKCQHPTHSEVAGIGYTRNNGLVDFGGRIKTAANGTSCTSTVHWDKSLVDCSSGHCKFTEVYKVKNPTIARDGNKFSLIDAQMQHVKDSEVSAALKAKQFKV